MRQNNVTGKLQLNITSRDMPVRDSRRNESHRSVIGVPEVVFGEACIVLQKPDTFTQLLTRKAPKSEQVAPRYPQGALKCLRVKSSTVAQFSE